MELTAATTAVKLCRMITKELEYTIDEIHYWTDSMSVLRYIANTKTRFNTFVANRLEVIQDATNIDQWHYVDTKQNPADLASRGTSIDKFRSSMQWFSGPEFLWKAVELWQDNSASKTLDLSVSDDPEIRGVGTVCAVQPESTFGLDRLIEHFSDSKRLIKVVALFIRAIDKYKTTHNKLSLESVRNEKSTEKKIDMISTEMIVRAEKVLLVYVQRKHFIDEIEVLQKQQKGNMVKHLKSSSKLRKLNPFLDDEGLLRVGGRLERSDIQYDAMHPIILLKDSTVSRLIIDKIHRSIGHLGRNSMLAVLRQHYWILGANAIIKRLIAKCVLCRKYQGALGKQKMASLPEERLKADDPPFTRIGIDFFGPFEIKQGRSVVKRYGVIFTCLNIRAIHLELAHSLDTDSCINAIRRFIARRGVPEFIRTDNGTNLVGSERELREEINRWNMNQIQEFMIQGHIQWEFNPPSASHFGGVWERLIRSMRKLFFLIMHEQNIRLTDEGLMTLFCEVEGILNGRPITEASNSITDLKVLTPNHLILQRPGKRFPPGVFSKTDNYVKRRWRQIQYLADLFWNRWRKEYLPLLQNRQKWTKSERNMQLGDIVLIADNAPRNSWNMARVIEVIKDKNNVVRVVKVKTSNSVLMRPVAKLCLLVESD